MTNSVELFEEEGDTQSSGMHCLRKFTRVSNISCKSTCFVRSEITVFVVDRK